MAAATATHVYVYYRVADDTEAARDAIGMLFREVEQACGIVGRLMVRCEDPRTWMEAYEPIDDRDEFLQTLALLVARSSLVTAIAEQGRRHVECFTSLAALQPPDKQSGTGQFD